VWQLRRHWLSVFGSWCCDVRGIKNGPRAIGYVLKYLGKAWPNVGETLQIAGFYRTKRLTTQGEFYGRRLSALLMHGPTRATGLERVRVRLCCEGCGTAVPRLCAIAPNDRHRRECKSLHGPPSSDGTCVCGAWRAPRDCAPYGRAWTPPAEWRTAGRPLELASLPSDAEPAATIAVDWTGALAWEDVQRVSLVEESSEAVPAIDPLENRHHDREQGE